MVGRLGGGGRAEEQRSRAPYGNRFARVKNGVKDEGWEGFILLPFGFVDVGEGAVHFAALLGDGAFVGGDVIGQ